MILFTQDDSGILFIKKVVGRGFILEFRRITFVVLRALDFESVLHKSRTITFSIQRSRTFSSTIRKGIDDIVTTIKKAVTFRGQI